MDNTGAKLCGCDGEGAVATPSVALTEWRDDCQFGCYVVNRIAIAAFGAA